MIIILYMFYHSSIHEAFTNPSIQPEIAKQKLQS